MGRTTSGRVLAAGLGLFALLAATLTSAQQPAGRKVFENSVTPLPESGPTPSGLMVQQAVADHSKEKMDLLFYLPASPEAEAKLEERVLKGEVITPDELKKDYGPKPEDVERVTKWLKAEGFVVTHTSQDRTGVYVRGTLAQIEKSLQVKMVRVTFNGLTYNAAQKAPSLPADIGVGVHAVIGTQPFRQFTKQSRIHRPTTAEPTTNVNTVPGLLVKDVLKAYNADAVGVTGKGQKIAILIDTVPLDTDTAHYWQVNGLPVTPTRVQKVNVTGQPLPPPEGEESLDVQWSSGIARDATIKVYATGTLQFVNLDRGLDRILTDAMTDPSLRQVSISLGLGEQFLSPAGTLDGEVLIEHKKFLRFAALGVNLFVSSGDAGSNPDQTGHGSGPLTQVEWQASSPFAVGVGGTSLHITTGGVTERAWPGSGGGLSKVFDRPAYQNRPGFPAGTKRMVPDVSLLADPATGGYVRLNGNDVVFGGTSLSAPVWAGFCALLNESRVKLNKPTLPALNPLLYQLAGTNCFRDITVGSNGVFHAGPGFDMVTGLGVPHIQNLMGKLNQ
ncbi:MAG TPA: S53 family peptidase [Urbifossiella sp.]|jgi:kumamolisin|nr:S53 family peptidase [Urbifossiella sp.]